MSESMPLRSIVTSVLVPCATVLPVFLAGAASVQLAADVGVDTATLGLLAAAFFAFSALGSMPAGWLVERRLGAGSGLRLSAVWSAACLIAIGAADGAGAMLVFMAVAGFGNALSQPAANLLLARRIPYARQGFYFALKQSSIQAAGLLAGLAVPLVVVQFGWRWAYVAGAGVAALAAFVSPRHVDGAAASAAVHDRRPRPLPIFALAIAAGLAAASVAPLATFLVKGAVTAGVSEAAAGAILSIASVVSIVSRLAAGRIADRHGGEALIAVTAMLAVGVLGYVGMAMSGAWFLVGAFVAYAAGWGWPGLYHLSVVRHHAGSPSFATGITQSAVFLGGVAGPAVFGLVAQHSGFTPAWLTSGALMAAGSGAMAAALRLLRVQPDCEGTVSVCHD